MRLCELRQKEIINTCTCKSLGCPIDLEFDCATGRIHSLIVPGPGKFCSFFGRENEYIIPWNCICQIGDDIILVEIKEEKFFPKKNISRPPCESFVIPNEIRRIFRWHLIK